MQDQPESTGMFKKVNPLISMTFCRSAQSQSQCRTSLLRKTLDGVAIVVKSMDAMQHQPKPGGTLLKVVFIISKVLFRSVGLGFSCGISMLGEIANQAFVKAESTHSIQNQPDSGRTLWKVVLTISKVLFRSVSSSFKCGISLCRAMVARVAAAGTSITLIRGQQRSAAMI